MKIVKHFNKIFLQPVLLTKQYTRNKYDQLEKITESQAPDMEHTGISLPNF